MHWWLHSRPVSVSWKLECNFSAALPADHWLWGPEGWVKPWLAALTLPPYRGALSLHKGSVLSWFIHANLMLFLYSVLYLNVNTWDKQISVEMFFSDVTESFCLSTTHALYTLGPKVWDHFLIHLNVAIFPFWLRNRSCRETSTLLYNAGLKCHQFNTIKRINRNVPWFWAVGSP